MHVFNEQQHLLNMGCYDYGDCYEIKKYTTTSENQPSGLCDQHIVCSPFRENLTLHF